MTRNSNKRTAGISNLPEDIWTGICQFLTEDQIRGMYSVNRPLYRISMRLRYHEVSIGRFQGVGSEETLRCLSVSENPELLGYVHSLKITPTRIRFSENPHDKDASPFDTTAGRIGQLAAFKLVAARFRSKTQSFNSPTRLVSSSSVMRRGSTPPSMRNKVVHELESLISSLDHLMHLKIHWPETSGAAPTGANWSISLLSSGWDVFGSNLRSLTLSGSIATWELMLSHSLHLEKLESLSIRVDMGFKNPNDDTYAIRLVLAPFIRRHSRTLKALCFASRISTGFPAFYDGAGRLPLLERLEIEQPCLLPRDNHTEELNQFLMRHLDTLTSFRWMFTPPLDGQGFATDPQEWFEQPPYHLTLPRLRELCLGFPTLLKLDLFEGSLFYSARHTQTLTKLSFGGLIFTLAQFHELLLLLGSKQVQELSISLEVLTSAVLVNLSNKFPGLQVLSLAYNLVGRQKSLSEPTLVDPTAGGILKIPNVSVVKMWQFRQDMASLVLRGWPLNTLYLRRAMDQSWREYRIEQAGRFVVKSLPRVGFVNGMYREAFLQL